MYCFQAIQTAAANAPPATILQLLSQAETAAASIELDEAATQDRASPAQLPGSGLSTRDELTKVPTRDVKSQSTLSIGTSSEYTIGF